MDINQPDKLESSQHARAVDVALELIDLRVEIAALRTQINALRGAMLTLTAAVEYIPDTYLSARLYEYCRTLWRKLWSRGVV